jgi:(2Fe-2S) ferredoxin
VVNAIDGAPCKLTVCRGCCCGTKKKVPGVDHDAQLARLSVIDDHSARRVPVRTSKCLGICFQANVVVVQPSREGRAAGGRPVWLGRMTEDRLLDAVDDWIFEGGPGIAPLPAVLEGRVTSKDAKKPKKSKKHKKGKHSEATKKGREKAEEKLAKQARKDRKAEERARREVAETAWSQSGPPYRPQDNEAEKARTDEKSKSKKDKSKKNKASKKDKAEKDQAKKDKDKGKKSPKARGEQGPE